MSNSFQRSTAGTTAGEAIDIKKTRRRIEDALRKTATRDEILHIAKLLRIKVEPVKREECSRCGQIDYMASDEYPLGISVLGGKTLCHQCCTCLVSESNSRHDS